MQKIRRTITSLPLLIVFGVLASFSVALISSSSSQASVPGWNAGNIMSDSVFTNHTSMSVNQIQNFLNSKMPNCDTWGNKTSEYGGGTRAQYGASRGNPAPFTCLKDYKENGKSAAQIIRDAAHEFRINPQVLIVLLQKEQGLITDEWPFKVQYRTATGYGCPDTAPCDSQYFGLTNQLRWAGRMFRAIMNDSSSWYTPYVLGNNYIQYNPDASCGGSNVYIQNRATKALYNYTPYQPNRGALNAGWGTANCGAYGNRNFYLYFTSWFGGAHNNSPLEASNVNVSTTKAGTGQPIYVTYTVRNPNSYAVTVPSIGISNRMGGKMYDFNVQKNVRFNANETKTFTGTYFPGASGTYAMRVSYNISGAWWTGNASNVQVKQPVLSASQALKSTPEWPLVGQQHKVEFEVKNTGDVEAHLTHLMAANMSGNTAVGYPSDDIVIIRPGQTYKYQANRAHTNATQQKAWISYMLPTGSWHKVGRDHSFRSYASAANPQITQPIATNPAHPVINRSTEATFKIRNTGDQPIRYKNIGIQNTRDKDGTRHDYTSRPTGSDVVINGNSEFTYKASRQFPTKDTYTMSVTASEDGKNWNGSLPVASGVSRNTTVQTYSSPARMEVTQPLRNMTINQGGLATLTYTVRNAGDQPTGRTTLAFYCRLNGSTYCDVPGDNIPNLAHGESHTVTRTLSYTQAGNYTLRALRHYNGKWENFGPKSVTMRVNSAPLNANTFKTEMSLDKTSIKLGDTVTATYKITNNTGARVQVPRYAMGVRVGNSNFDTGFKDWFVINAGETKTFTVTIKPTRKGTYSLFPVVNFNGAWRGYTTQHLWVI